ncbi:hypothetical protein JQ607_16215 [Bradyrhizobium liaoningense]|uniref:VPA1269 family protein n=1 Tax=Bradyrhizobium liaoningense TaxID=43992 RepID=UPI001BA73B96|nr:VPA1269 family protein [Bradyrhizobium liaoningense]MBR0841743.1 hypothetical protein [Bradyrhizobium liaoningense]
MSEFSYFADTKIEGVWFNGSLSLFAVIPDAPNEEAEITAATVEELVRSFRAAIESGNADAQDEALAELGELHARHLVLWPLGVQWDQSVLGKVHYSRFALMLEEVDQPVLDLRNELPALMDRFSPGYAEQGAKDRVSEIWRQFVTLRFATIGLNELYDIREEHVFALFNSMRVDGFWAAWATEGRRRMQYRFGRFLAALLEEPMFCASFLNPSRRMKIGPRVAPILLSHPYLAWLESAFEIWLDESISKTKKNGRIALKLLTDFLKTLKPELTEPAYVFSRKGISGLAAFATNWRNIGAQARSMPRLMDFAEWYCYNYVLREGHRAIELEWKRYDFDQFLRTLPNSTRRSGEVSARPMPTRYHRILKQILTENDFAWPKSILHAHTGKPFHWFAWNNPETGKIEPVFCEVLPRLLLLLLELPLRNIQARRLDSGEGDDREYDIAAGTWRDARGPHAGYWTAQRAKNVRRGVFREIVTETGTLAGFWINSNKTQSRSTLFDETSGYEIPWQHDEVIENLAAMRRWQEKYNPVAGPLEYDNVPSGIFVGEEPSRAVRAVLPARFYLFRYPLNVGNARAREAPPGYYALKQFYMGALEELEKRLREEDPEADIQIITERDISNFPSRAIFTMHGMRASTLTALHLAGVPIGVLSKLVAGHATILMTLRYTKFDPAHVNEILNNARTKAMLESKDRFANFLKSATIKEAMRMSARMSDDGLDQMKGPYAGPGNWSKMDIGFCPNGATMCRSGGEAIVIRRDKQGDRSAYHPVPGGPRNCVRCRFFVTGVPFMIPLWAQASAILARVDSISARIRSIETENNDLKVQKRSLGSDAPTSLADRIRVLNELFVSESDSRDQALADLHATLFLLEKVRAIAGSGDSEDDVKLPMLLGADGVPQLSARESTRFELVDAVVQASRWFPSLVSTDLEAERNEFLNRILYSNGYVPITLSPLSPDERRRAADAMAQMLLVELGAAETQNVIDGRKSLADVGLQDKIERAAEAAIGRPIERLVLAPPSVPVIEAAAE